MKTDPTYPLFYTPRPPRRAAAEGRTHTQPPKTQKHSVASIDMQRRPEGGGASSGAPVQGHTHAALCHCGVAHMECTWTAYVCTARAAGTRASTVIRW